jgi:hypothetical protein
MNLALQQCHVYGALSGTPFGEKFMNGNRETLSFPDGATIDIYYDDDHYLHRDDGPAWALRSPNGVSVEMYFLHGKLSGEMMVRLCVRTIQAVRVQTDIFSMAAMSVPTTSLHRLRRSAARQTRTSRMREWPLQKSLRLSGRDQHI